MGLDVTRLFKTAITWLGVPLLLGVAALLISIDQFRFSELLLIFSGMWICGWIAFPSV
jgi:hypothetical protein